MTAFTAISLWQPWASLLLAGRKVHETRHWRAPTRIIGQRIVIHAAQKKLAAHDIDTELHELCMDEFGCSYMHSLPFGAAIGTMLLQSCKLMSETQPHNADDEVAGNWAPDRFAWLLGDPTPFTPSIPMIARHSLWTVEIDERRAA